MKASPQCFDLIKEFEGCKLLPYQDSVGVWTVGYGSTTDVQPGEPISQAEAESRLAEDVLEAEKGVSDAVRVSLTQHEFDALVCFTFNLGIGNLKKSTLLKMINAGQIEEAAGEFKKWTKAGGVELPGLVRRRYAEMKLFESA